MRPPRLGARLLDIAHERIQQDDGEDGQGFVGEGRVALVEPQRGRDGGGDEQQDDEHILELREELTPGGTGVSTVNSFLPCCPSRNCASRSVKPRRASAPSAISTSETGC